MAVSGDLGEVKEARLRSGVIRYRERGEGPVLLFFHEFPASGDTWRRVVPDLARDFRCVVPDWPYGVHDVAMDTDADLSPPGIARLVTDFLDSIGIDRVTIVGAGGGGTLGQVFAAEQPDRVERLVLTTGDSLEHFPARALIGFRVLARMPAAALWLFFQVGRIRAARRFWFGLASRHLPDDDAILRGSYMRPLLTNAGVRRDVRRAISQVDSKHSLLAAGKLAVLDKPALLVWSTDDRFFHVEDAHRLAAMWRDARVELIDHDRTFIPEDHPQRFVALCREFLGVPVAA